MAEYGYDVEGKKLSVTYTTSKNQPDGADGKHRPSASDLCGHDFENRLLWKHDLREWKIEQNTH